jgi:hypothetical protein
MGLSGASRLAQGRGRRPSAEASRFQPRAAVDTDPADAGRITVGRLLRGQVEPRVPTVVADRRDLRGPEARRLLKGFLGGRVVFTPRADDSAVDFVGRMWIESLLAGATAPGRPRPQPELGRWVKEPQLPGRFGRLMFVLPDRGWHRARRALSVGVGVGGLGAVAEASSFSTWNAAPFQARRRGRVSHRSAGG